jgi:hypothetical protein
MPQLLLLRLQPYRHQPHFWLHRTLAYVPINCTHCINGADGTASAATQNHRHKKPSSTVNHQSSRCPSSSHFPPIALFEIINCKTDRFKFKVRNCKSSDNGKNLEARVYFIFYVIVHVSLTYHPPHYIMFIHRSDLICDECYCIKLTKNWITPLKCELFISLKNMQMQTIVSNM